MEDVNRLCSYEELLAAVRYDQATGQFFNVKKGNKLITTKKVRVGTRVYLRHNLAWYWVKKEYPQFVVEYIDKDKTNCAIDNLQMNTNIPIKVNKIAKGNTKSVEGIVWRECTLCKMWKVESDEFNFRGDVGRYRSDCKACHAKRKKEYYSTERGEETKTNARLKLKFGITKEEYESKLETQNGCCKICGVHHEKLNKRLAVDHDHVTGKVRGLLCANCNVGVGFLQDSVQVVEAAAEYLRGYK